MAVIGINYNEGGKPLDYQSVYLHHFNGEEIFASGDFVKDWYDATKYFIQHLLDTEGHLSESSTVDHFIMDGAPYDSGYMEVEDGKGVLYYGTSTRGLEFFVKEDTTPTWDELRELCGDKK